MVDEFVEDETVSNENLEHSKQYLTEEFATQLEELKVPYQIEIVKFATDTDSIGSIICKRAAQLNAGIVVMAKHNKGCIKEFLIGSCTNYWMRAWLRLARRLPMRRFPTF